MRKFVEMTKDFAQYQKGKVYFFDTRVGGDNYADAIVRRGFGTLVPDPNAKEEAPPEEVPASEEVETKPEPIKALGDATGDPDRAELMARAKELGVPNYWVMKNKTLAEAIAEREEEAE